MSVESCVTLNEYIKKLWKESRDGEKIVRPQRPGKRSPYLGWPIDWVEYVTASMSS